jgi:RNA-directed DNA polymerase
MGLFGWLKKLFGGTPPADPAAELNRVLEEVRRELDADMPPSPKAPRSPKPTTASTQITPAAPVPATQPSTQFTATPPPIKLPPAPDLDAADFLPIGRAELVEKAGEQSPFSSPWFGRRDLIPPADDPRTKLIDRGMVSQGLLTPEQLVEIHEVGAEMERVRPSLVALEAEVQKAGEAAVEADRARRAALKEEKKKAAAEKKRLRAERIARHRATDIVFLGRGVSGWLGRRQADVARLTALGLPVLATPADIAAALGLSIPHLRWLAFHTEVATRIHYVQFQVPKRSGGLRQLSAPHKKLATAQRWILTNILNKLPAEPAAHGFVAGRSVVSNAAAHTNRAAVLNMDLTDFFPSIGFRRVRSVFMRLGYSPAAAAIFALLCTECPRKQVEYAGKPYYVATGPRGLPQGACTSPALSNQVARRLDKRLAGLAGKLGLSYTRYADDLTFSGDEAFSSRIGYVMARIRHIAENEGFAVNHRKSRVLRQSAAQMVTGLVVNHRPTLARKEIRRLRAILHRAETEGLDAQNRQGRANFRAWLQGKIAYLSMVRPEIGTKMRRQLEKLGGASL